jgi:hypothetical protein
LVCEYQKCKIYILSSVNHREEFSSALREDTIITSYFKAMIDEPLFIQINDIKSVPADNNAYVFTIFAYPQKDSDTDIIKRVLMGSSRMKYRVKTKLEFNPIRIKILHIELAENRIEI